MKSINEIKEEQQRKVDTLIKDCKVFFAFSNEQFQANKTPLEEGEKYVSIGAGGYMPKGQVEKFKNGMDNIDIWYKQSIKANKARKQNIAYELANHEAYYTCSIDDTLEALGSDYTREEVQEVYNKERKKQYK